MSSEKSYLVHCRTATFLSGLSEIDGDTLGLTVICTTATSWDPGLLNHVMPLRQLDGHTSWTIYSQVSISDSILII